MADTRSGLSGFGEQRPRVGWRLRLEEESLPMGSPVTCKPLDLIQYNLCISSQCLNQGMLYDSAGFLTVCFQIQMSPSS